MRTGTSKYKKDKNYLRKQSNALLNSLSITDTCIKLNRTFTFVLIAFFVDFLFNEKMELFFSKQCIIFDVDHSHRGIFFILGQTFLES